MGRIHAAVALASAMLTLPAAAQAPRLPDEIVCPRTRRPPNLDGALDDACWQVAATVSNFTRPLTNDPARKSVSARLCFDGEALYIAFECEERAPGRIKARARDGSADVWKDDCVEVWLRTGDSQLEFDQFIVNAAGARQSVRVRPGGASGGLAGGWRASARIGKTLWTAEIAIPFAALGTASPKRADMMQVKFGREDYATARQTLSTWPPGTQYGPAGEFGRLYFESANVLINPDMSRQKDGRIEGWGFGDNDRPLFSSVRDEGRSAIRFDAPGRYSVAQQHLRLPPDSVYRLDARVKGSASVYLRARTSRRKGEPTQAYSVNSSPGDEYRDLQVRFPTGQTGDTLIIIGNTEGLGKGEVFIADLRVSRDVSYDADGPAIPVAPGKPLTVEKLLVTDCRALRGFVVAPVDGRLDSYNWNMDVWEYGMRGAGAGVGYRYRNNDGLHVTLADDQGVDAVIIRRGARVKLYADAQRYDDPGGARLVWEFKGRAKTSRALFPNRVKSRRFSFFDLEDGYIADVSFLRLTDEPPPADQRDTTLAAGPQTQPAELEQFLTDRFRDEDRACYRLRPGAPAAIAVRPKQTIHLLSEPFQQEAAVRAVALQLDVPDAPTGCPLTIAVQDPLNPRQELMSVDFSIEAGGDLRPVLDFPDQIVAPGNRLWLSITLGAPATIRQASVEPLRVARERAVPEALAFRKLIMKGLFCALSEARQWTALRKNTDLEKFYRENHWGPGVKDLAQTIAQCKWLGPTDDTVRCYDEWFWRTARDLPKFEPKIDRVPGAPEWAVLARQAWLTARAVPKWWLDNRVVPTGEFGGLVGDDSDMYQNYADFPMFENDGVAAEIKRAAANLAELAEAENLENGLNKHTMDPLHAYEEGVNHEALMLWWFYGDPIYFERCLLAAKSMPALTVVTQKGHRHFKNQDCGAEDLRIQRELGVDGHAHPLMLHPCFEVAWYNGSPKVIRFLQEWADGWLQHQKPGEYATSVDVKAEKATATSRRPLYGGYGGQASAHNFLYWLTGDLKYIRPFMDFFEKGQDNWPARKFVPELYHRGALDEVQKRDSVLRGNPITQAIALGDKQPLLDALKGDIAELQRFWTMYTDAEVFTDRVFLYAITNAAMCYTGGYATRNKYNHTHAASWEGFGTDYAALVLSARRDRFKALIYNFRDQPNRGRIRFWTLDHGRYRLTLGRDADADDVADAISREETVEVARATAVPLSLPPKAVAVLELQQVQRLDDITSRPDLAVAKREMRIEDGVLTGVVHNIGAREAARFTVALLDAGGKTRARQSLGPHAAPLDLEPKRVNFRRLPRNLRGYRLVVDPQDEIPEIFEGNNACDL
ncbi:MAG: sugar-binding protein [Armatimonadota bacterium]